MRKKKACFNEGISWLVSQPTPLTYSRPYDQAFLTIGFPEETLISGEGTVWGGRLNRHEDFFPETVDGSQIRRAPVDMVVLSHYFQDFI